MHGQQVTVTHLLISRSSAHAVNSVLAIGGVGGLAIGLAGREILENLFTGLIILSSSPFEVGEEVLFTPPSGPVSDSLHPRSIILFFVVTNCREEQGGVAVQPAQRPSESCSPVMAPRMALRGTRQRSSRIRLDYARVSWCSCATSVADNIRCSPVVALCRCSRLSAVATTTYFECPQAPFPACLLPRSRWRASCWTWGGAAPQKCSFERDICIQTSPSQIGFRNYLIIISFAAGGGHCAGRWLVPHHHPQLRAGDIRHPQLRVLPQCGAQHYAQGPRVAHLRVHWCANSNELYVDQTLTCTSTSPRTVML